MSRLYIGHVTECPTAGGKRTFNGHHLEVTQELGTFLLTPLKSDAILEASVVYLDVQSRPGQSFGKQEQL